MSSERTGPSEGEARQALRTLLAYSDASRRAQWDEVVDALVESPALDADQLYQAHRHAERKRWLLANVALLGASAFVRLMPDRADADRNTARVLARLRAEGEVLAVRVKRDWKYPAAQLAARGEVHETLPELIRRARGAGYDAWETLYWLAAPFVEPADDVVPGRPLAEVPAGASLEDIAAAAVARHGAEAPPPSTAAASPFDLLARDDVAAFERAARRWLG